MQLINESNTTGGMNFFDEIEYEKYLILQKNRVTQERDRKQPQFISSAICTVKYNNIFLSAPISHLESLDNGEGAKSRLNFSQAYSRIALVYQLFCSLTKADRLH